MARTLASYRTAWADSLACASRIRLSARMGLVQSQPKTIL